MHKSFYHYLMKYREEPPRDELAAFANHAFDDHSFPKMADSYDVLCRYLEMDAGYLPTMGVFDEAWEKYEQDELNR
ncbi:YozE family protein [Domibacillus indicus]|uniref:YozE family protein n=1 Tax=Domibacillus indicus TaxID=1437523 RepID=UPI000617E662|nr:YozE family protein [Domibacillus indicus]